MALRVFNNIFSVNSQRALGINNGQLQGSLEKLSSGLRINRAADDAAGLAISENMRSDIRAMGQAIRNTNDGIALINTAEGGLQEQASMLIRMRELASQASTGTVSSAQRATINLEFQALSSEIDRSAAVTEFNGQTLLAGELASTVSTASSVIVQVGIHNTTNDQLNFNQEVNLTAMTTTGLGISTLDTTTAANARTAMTTLESAINTVNDGRGRLGAFQNRLEHTVANLSSSVENLTAAESQIRDTDYASAISDFTKNQILSQASTAILAQANLVPQSVLQLLG